MDDILNSKIDFSPNFAWICLSEGVIREFQNLFEPEFFLTKPPLLSVAKWGFVKNKLIMNDISIHKDAYE